MYKGIFSLSLLPFLIFIPAAEGATIYVPDDHTTIQGAINASLPGDKVIVRPGTYLENIDFSGKAISLESEMGPQVTVIDGSRKECVVTFESGEGADSVIEGFTITNGETTAVWKGGGIWCDKASSPVIRNNIITDNKSPMFGGGIYCMDSSSPLIEGNEISANSSTYGGGIRISESAPLLVNNTIFLNTAESGGGGVSCFTSAAVISGNIITENGVVLGSGGGIYCSEQSSIVIEDNLISGNHAMGGTYTSGGGIHSFESTTTIRNNVVKGNAAPFGGGIWCSEPSFVPMIEGNIIDGNTGSGLNCSDCSPLVKNNIIVNNSASSGAGLKFYLSSATVTNNTVVGNDADQFGGGIWCQDSYPTITNTIFWKNSAKIQGPEIYVYSGTPDITFCDVKGGWTGTGNIDADPLFIDASQGDFHIVFDSPCRSAGSRHAPGLPDVDFEGDPRTGLFAFPDMGADEFHTHFYVNGKVSSGGTATGVIIGWPQTSPVMLISGSDVLTDPMVTPYGDFWLQPPWEHRVHFQPIPNNGVRPVTRIYSGSLPPGTTLPVQALVGTELSNLCVIEVE